MSKGEVIVGLKVMPESPETDIERLKGNIRKAIPKSVDLVGMQEKYIAFGLRAINVTVIVPDAAGGSAKVEEAISKLPGVGSISIIGTGLL